MRRNLWRRGGREGGGEALSLSENLEEEETSGNRVVRLTEEDGEEGGGGSGGEGGVRERDAEGGEGGALPGSPHPHHHHHHHHLLPDPTTSWRGSDSQNWSTKQSTWDHYLRESGTEAGEEEEEESRRDTDGGGGGGGRRTGSGLGSQGGGAGGGGGGRSPVSHLASPSGSCRGAPEILFFQEGSVTPPASAGMRNSPSSHPAAPRRMAQDVGSYTSYESVQLPGSIMDDTRPLAHSDALQAKYDKLNNSFKPQKASDDSKVRKTVETLFFRDNKRRIDFVLVYRDDEDPILAEHRRLFEENLIEEGLELETEDKTQSQDGETYFVKVHAPWDLLTRYAEIMKLKKPIKKDDAQTQSNGLYGWLGIRDPFQYDHNRIPPEPTYFSTGFTRNHVEQFIIKDRETFFSPAQRSMIAWEILLRVRYSEEELGKRPCTHARTHTGNQGVGVSRLLSSDTYVAAFPLHDGRYDKDGPDGEICDRRLLYMEWAHYTKWYKKQPLHVVRRYFGDKMALYFAWLGFYTEMLIPAAILGTFTFICGLFIMFSDFNQPSNEICSQENNSTGNIIMCPLCDKLCDFWRLKDSCLNSRITFLFDNPMTVFFSIAMSFWATMFLELWKRKQAVIQWQWDLENYEEEEELRPEFEEKVTTTRINPVTNKPEPYLPLWSQITRLVATHSIVLLMLFVVLAAVVSVIIYRMAVAVAMYQVESPLFRRNAKLVTSITAASLNLVIILIFNFFYEKLVVWLTNLEVPRTETEYEDSFTLKMFLFQFVNYYSSLIYIAFFKGRFFYHPGDEDARSNVLMQLRYDMCDPAGCLFELFVQLAIIMIGKQLFNNAIEIIFPILKVWWNKRRGHNNQLSEAYTRWEQDYDLEPYTRLSLFNEYLEMVIQYGFVTIFVAAFPLAPIFALLNNIVEIRLDAYKYLSKCRRPRAERIQDIGIWYSILKGITYFSVFTNAVVISYTSDFIPRLVYIYGYSKNHNLEGYIKNTLSVFNTSEYKDNMGPEKRDGWPPVCHYRAYRNGPDTENPYDITQQFWHVFTARLAFILIFEHVVFLLTGAIAMAIPDIPVEVRNQMKREKKVEKETLFENEMRKIRQERQGRQVASPDDDTNHLNLDLGEGLTTTANSHRSSPSAHTR